MVVIRGGLSDGSRVAVYQKTLSIECPYSILFCHVLFYSSFFFVVLVLFCVRFHALVGDIIVLIVVGVPFIFSCPADHVLPDWQPHCLLLGMVEALSVHVKNTHTHTH